MAGTLNALLEMKTDFIADLCSQICARCFWRRRACSNQARAGVSFTLIARSGSNIPCQPISSGITRTSRAAISSASHLVTVLRLHLLALTILLFRRVHLNSHTIHLADRLSRVSRLGAPPCAGP